MTLRTAIAFCLVLLFTCQVPAQESSEEAIALYSDAANIQNEGEFELAVDEWKRFINKYPSDARAPLAKNYLGVCQLQIKKYAEAISSFQNLLSKHPKFEQREDVLMNLANAHYSWGQAGQEKEYTLAASSFEALLKEFPKSKYIDQALYFQADALKRSGDTPEAVKLFQQVAEKFPKSELRASAFYSWGTALEEQKKYAEAGKVYEQFIQIFPTHKMTVEVKMLKGETLLQTGKFAEAEAILSEVSKLSNFPLIDHALFQLGYALLKQDKVKAAADNYASIVNRYPSSDYAAQAAMLAGRGYYRLKDYTTAEKWLNYSIKLGGVEGAEAAHWLCQIYLKTNKFSDAVKLAKAQIPKAKDAPYLVYLELDLADAVYAQEDHRKESIKLYEDLVKKYPEHEVVAQALYNAAFAAMETQDYAKSIQISQDFAKKFPKHSLLLDSQYVAAESSLQKGDLAQAETFFRTMVQIGSKHKDYEIWIVRLALSQFLQKKYLEITSTLPKAIKSIKKTTLHAEANFLVGASYFYQDEFTNADKFFHEALRHNYATWERADEVQLMLSRSARKQNRTKEAIEIVNSLLTTKFPEVKAFDEAYFRLGEYHYADANFVESAKNYQKVLTDHKNSKLVPHAHYGLAWAFLRQKNSKDSIEQFSQLISNYADHQLATQAYHGRAIARQLAGDFDAGANDIDQYLKLAPNAADKGDALYVKGLCLVGSNKNEDAAQLFSTLQKDFPQAANGDKITYELAWSLKSSGKEAEALAQFNKLTTDFPKSHLTSEAFFHLGEAAYQKEDYPAAEQLYVKSTSSADDPDIGEKAFYKLAWSKYQQKQFKEALETYRKQGTNYPNGKLFNDARFMAGECLFEAEEYSNAIAAYQGVAQDKLTSDEKRALLLLHSGQSAGQLKRWADSRKYLTQLKSAYPKSLLNAEANYELGWASYNEKKTEEALQSFETAAELSRGKTGARARFMRGEIFFEQKKYEDASKEFKRVVYGFGGKDSVDEVKPWQAKCAYELGRCNEVQIREAKANQRDKFIEDATKFYRLATQQYPSSAEAKLASARLTALSKL